MTSIMIDQIDGLSSATAVKGPCRVATTANITPSGTQTIDGVAVVADDRVLVKNQTTGSANGIYVVATGAWRRAKDFSRNKDVRKGTQILVTDGTVGAGVWYVTTANPITFDTTSISFARPPVYGITPGAAGQAILAAATAGDVRDYLSIANAVNIEWFGAVGDDETDNTDAIQDAFDYATANGLAVLVPAGTFITEKLTIADASLTIVGEGSSHSILKFTAAGDNGIEWTSAAATNTLQVSNLQIITTAAMTGAAILADVDTALGVVAATVTLVGVLITRSGAGYWTGGVSLDNCRHAIVERVNVVGTYGSSVYGVKFLGNTTDAMLINSTAANMDYGFDIAGTCEGSVVNGCLVINADVGLRKSHASGEPGLYLTSSHFNCHEKCLELVNVMQANIVGNLLYANPNGAMAGINMIDISGSNAKDIILTGNILHGTNYTGGKKGIVAATGARLLVDGNTFIDLDTGTELGASASSSIVTQSNRYNGVTTRVSDAGTANERSQWRILAASAVAVSHTGNTSETGLAVVSIPAGAMGANGALRISAQWSMTNNANNKFTRVKLGGVGGTSFHNVGHTTAVSMTSQTRIANRNDAASQVGGQVAGATGLGSGNLTTATVDTSAATSVAFVGQLANAADTVTLESYMIELMHRD